MWNKPTKTYIVSLPTKQQGGKFHMKYIITPDVPLEKTEDNLIYVLSPEQVEEYQNRGFKYKERMYKITIDCIPHEIVCGEIWKNGDNEHSVIIPAFLVLRRPNPLDVYVYAINLYCGSPQISLRAAAEATKEKFKLKKFSHTAISRAIKKLSGMLEKHNVADAVQNTISAEIECSTMGSMTADLDVSVELSAKHDSTPETTVRPTSAEYDRAEEQKEKQQGNKANGKECKKSFPTKKDTLKRREFIMTFFNGKVNIQNREGFKEACERIAVWWYAQFNRLLI